MESIITVAEGETLRSVGPFMYIEAECQIWCVPTYSLCSFRCTYCNIEAQGKSRPAFERDAIPGLIAAFKPYANTRPLLVGAEGDPYPPEEKTLRFTREFLQALTREGIHFRLVTKGDAILADLDILRDNPCLELVTVSLTSNDDAFLAYHESGAPNYATRLAVVHELKAAGLPVAVTICPWMPGLTPVEEIIGDLPEKMPVSIGVLTYNHHARAYMKYLYDVEVASAERVFGKTWTQEELVTAYLAEYERLKNRFPANVRWVQPPGSGTSFATYLPLGDDIPRRAGRPLEQAANPAAH